MRPVGFHIAEVSVGAFRTFRKPEETSKMTGLTRTLARTTAAAIVALSVVAPAEGAAILLDNANPQNIPGVTGFVTSGAMMTGMSVTAHFNNGSFETEFWGATGAMAGGASVQDGRSVWMATASRPVGTSSMTGPASWNAWCSMARRGLTVFDKREPALRHGRFVLRAGLRVVTQSRRPRCRYLPQSGRRWRSRARRRSVSDP